MMNGGFISVISTLRRAGLIYDRDKTIETMQKLSERLPEDVLYSLPPLVVFAPSAAKLGEVKPFGLGERLLLYLSPRLEAKPQSEVDFTVAHEFAHVSLGHQQPGATRVPPDTVVQSHEDVPSEQDADRLAESWGFALPKVGRRQRKKK
jgi:IrrE N-terminal-like domain